MRIVRSRCGTMHWADDAVRTQNAATIDAGRTRAGAVTAAIGSTLLRSHGIISPVQ